MDKTTEGRLSRYLASRTDVAFAFLFGSAAVGRQTGESDTDVAVYLIKADSGVPPGADQRGGPVDVEEADRSFAGEYELWSAVERICGGPVDLVILNRVPATLAAAALLTGRPLAIRDHGRYLDYYLSVTTLAEEERNLFADFSEISRRSNSLNPIDRSRLLRIVNFLAAELTDAERFASIDRDGYARDNDLRRSMERWVENLVNASIDVAKILVASERLPAPHTYRETVEMLVSVPGLALDSTVLRRLAENTRVRNLLAHEYLDIRYARVAEVIRDASRVYGALLEAVSRRLH